MADQAGERRCPICGAAVPSSARYCPSCGNRQPDADSVAPSFSAALEDVLDDHPSDVPGPVTITGPAEPTPTPSVWGPNDPPTSTSEVPPVYDEPVTVAGPTVSAGPADWSAAPPPPQTGWATTPEHWTNQQQPDLKQQGWRGNRALWLVLGIVGILFFCCCGFFFIVSAVSATEAAVAVPHAIVSVLA